MYFCCNKDYHWIMLIQDFQEMHLDGKVCLKNDMRHWTPKILIHIKEIKNCVKSVEMIPKFVSIIKINIAYVIVLLIILLRQWFSIKTPTWTFSWVEKIFQPGIITNNGSRGANDRWWIKTRKC